MNTATQEQEYLDTVTHPGAGVGPVVREADGVAAVTFDYKDPVTLGTQVHAAIERVIGDGRREMDAYARRRREMDARRRMASSGPDAARAFRSMYMNNYLVQSSQNDREWVTNARPDSAREWMTLDEADYIAYSARNLTDSIAAYQRQMMAAYGAGAQTPLREASGDRGAPRPLTPVEMPNRADIVREIPDLYDPALQGEDAQLAADAEDLLGYTPLAEKLGCQSRMLRVLAKLEIAILDETAVDAYKAQMVRHYESHNKMVMPTWRLHALADLAVEVPKFVLRKAVAIKRELPDARFYVDKLAIDPFLIVCTGDADDDPEDYAVNRSSRSLDAATQAYVEVWAEPDFEATL